MTVDISPAEPLSVQSSVDPDRWDAFVHTCNDSTFCHLSGWRTIIEKDFGHEFLMLEAVGSRGEIHGVMPLAIVQAWPLGKYAVSLPFMNYGGPIGSEAARTLLVDRAVGTAQDHSVDLLELRSRSRTECGLKVSQRKLLVLLPLPDTPDELWMGEFKSKMRTKIRRPMKEGMEARFGREYLDPFYRVFAHHMRDLGTPVLPRSFFERIAEVFSGLIHFGVVFSGDTPVACGCGFEWKGEFEITWASALREYSTSNPNMLLYWAFMERMIERGVDTFNFGRSSPDSGTHEFKKQWGGRDQLLPWLQWSKHGADSTPNPDSPVLGLAAALWSRLPLPVANRIGPTLARRLP